MAWQVTISRFEPWGRIKEKTNLQKIDWVNKKHLRMWSSEKQSCQQ
jgi:hypothetical protein